MPDPNRATRWQRRLLAAGAAGALGVGGLMVTASAAGATTPGGRATTATATRHSTTGATTGGSPYLAVANLANNSIAEYAKGASGAATPVAVIQGPATGLDAPDGLAIGPKGNLWVANSANSTKAAASITEYAPTATGDAAPITTITGPATGLATPSGLAFDSAGNLFVANFLGEVTEYGPSALSTGGNATPETTITTDIHGPEDIAINQDGELFVTNAGNPYASPPQPDNAVTEYGRISDGHYALVNTIQGPATGLHAPTGISLSPSGDLEVANYGTTSASPSVTVYPSGASGNQAPTATFTTGLSGPLLTDLAGGTLYVPNYKNDTVTALQGGKVVATISGPGLAGPAAVATADDGPPTPPAPPVHLATSNQVGIPDQTDQISVNNGGAVQVRWVDGAGAWHGPLAIWPSGLAPAGAPVAVSRQFGAGDQTDAFVVGNDGALYVLWVDGAGHWRGPLRISPTGLAPPGAHLAAYRQAGSGDQTDVALVGNGGVVYVVWVQGAGSWQGPLALTGGNAAHPGAPIAASQQFGIPEQTDVFTVDPQGAARVDWVDGAGQWQGPMTISGPGVLPADADLAVSRQFGIPDQTDVFGVDAGGTARVLWVQGAGSWQGPLAISPQGTAPAGADVAATQQVGAGDRTDVAVIGAGGATKVVWVQGAGAWQGPLDASGPDQAPPGSPISASPQYGLAQTDLFEDGDPSFEVLWADGAGSWHGPLGI